MRKNANEIRKKKKRKKSRKQKQENTKILIFAIQSESTTPDSPHNFLSLSN